MDTIICAECGRETPFLRSTDGVCWGNSECAIGYAFSISEEYFKRACKDFDVDSEEWREYLEKKIAEQQYIREIDKINLGKEAAVRELDILRRMDKRSDQTISLQQETWSMVVAKNDLENMGLIAQVEGAWEKYKLTTKGKAFIERK